MFNIKIETDSTLLGLKDSKSVEILSFLIQSESVESCDITIIFGNKKLIRDLKFEYFDIDKPTDVIAFRINNYEEKFVEGEIYICLPVAKENAEFYHEPYEKEIARLIIHGGLHLIGYDDDTDDNRNIMRGLEDKYLKELGF